MLRVMTGKKTLVSGIQPSGKLHIGNYFGALKQYVDLQDSHESFVIIVDLHALTTLQNGPTLKENILNIALDYLAVGLDPKKVTLFKQSDVSAHPELAWIFNCITTVPYLERAVAYKDANQKAKEVNVGLFDYPMLMAADILLYDPHVVPVGADQKQHVEYARDTAEKFNRIFGETFSMPEALILPDVGIVPGLDGRKMSKSYGNTIPLFATRDEIQKAVMSIVTDSGADIPENVYAIHKLFVSKEKLADFYESNKGKYKILKEGLIEDIDTFITPLREKRKALAEDPENILKILKSGGENARIRAEAKMQIVRDRIGVKLY